MHTQPSLFDLVPTDPIDCPVNDPDCMGGDGDNHWACEPPEVAEIDIVAAALEEVFAEVAAEMEAERAAPIPVPKPARRHPLRDAKAAFEKWMRDENVPYVAVDEAKRALDRSHPPLALRSFHYVVYSSAGPNLLVCLSRPDAVWRSTMEQWEKIFGAGFVAAFGQMREDGPAFTGLDRRPITLSA